MKNSFTDKVGPARRHEHHRKAPALTFNTMMNLLIKILAQLGLLTKDLDYHLVRASMVSYTSFLGIRNVPRTRRMILIPFFKNGPLISWMYPVFGIQGASWFLGVSEGLLARFCSWDSGIKS